MTHIGSVRNNGGFAVASLGGVSTVGLVRRRAGQKGRLTMMGRSVWKDEDGVKKWTRVKDKGRSEGLIEI